MKHSTRYICLYTLGLICSVMPVMACVLLYFPLWRERGGSCLISGFSLLLIILAAIPLMRVVKERLRSPSAYMVWLIIFIMFFSLSKIADEMAVISFVGFIGNLLGALFFNIARRGEKNE